MTTTANTQAHRSMVNATHASHLVGYRHTRSSQARDGLGAKSDATSMRKSLTCMFPALSAQTSAVAPQTRTRTSEPASKHSKHVSKHLGNTHSPANNPFGKHQLTQPERKTAGQGGRVAIAATPQRTRAPLPAEMPAPNRRYGGLTRWGAPANFRSGFAG